MDILQQYEKNQPQAPIQQNARQNAPSSDGLLIRMVIKLSGGKIQNRKRALMILLGIAGVGLLAAVVLIFQSTGVTQHPSVNAPPPETVGQQNQSSR